MIDDVTDQRLKDWVTTSYHMAPNGLPKIDDAGSGEIAAIG
jgi:predicted DNA-binding protein (MmcQ/YjbR family)